MILTQPAQLVVRLSVILLVAEPVVRAKTVMIISIVPLVANVSVRKVMIPTVWPAKNGKPEMVQLVAAAFVIPLVRIHVLPVRSVTTIPAVVPVVSVFAILPVKAR